MKHVQGLMIIIVISTCIANQSVQSQERPWDILEKSTRAKKAWEVVVPPDLIRLQWLAALTGPAGPVQTVMMHDRVFFYGESCKEHDCGANRVAFLIERDGDRAYGLVQMTFEGQTLWRYLGSPDAEARQLLKDALSH